MSVFPMGLTPRSRREWGSEIGKGVKPTMGIFMGALLLWATGAHLSLSHPGARKLA